MIQQTVFPFKMEMTEEKLTAQGGLVLMAEFNHGIGLRELTGQFCCLSLSILPKNLVHEWMIYLKKAPFKGRLSWKYLVLKISKSR